MRFSPCKPSGDAGKGEDGEDLFFNLLERLESDAIGRAAIRFLQGKETNEFSSTEQELMRVNRDYFIEYISQRAA